MRSGATIHFSLPSPAPLKASLPPVTDLAWLRLVPGTSSHTMLRHTPALSA
jgi:hypothetical protein